MQNIILESCAPWDSGSFMDLLAMEGTAKELLHAQTDGSYSCRLNPDPQVDTFNHNSYLVRKKAVLN